MSEEASTFSPRWVERQSRVFHENASRVSNQLAAIEAAMIAMPGIAYFEKNISPDGKHGIALTRIKDAWRLIYFDRNVVDTQGNVICTPVVNCTFETKALVAEALPEFLIEYQKAQQDRTRRAVKASRTLNRVAQMLGLSSLEGA
jgi:hypothetical protein